MVNQHTSGSISVRALLCLRCLLILPMPVTIKLENRHGEDQPRFARTWSLQPRPKLADDTNRLITITKFILFWDIPSQYEKRISDTCVDELVWQNHWVKYIVSLREGWSNISLLVCNADLLEQRLTLFPGHRSAYVSLLGSEFGVTC